MKKILAMCFAVFGLAGFEGLSLQLHTFDVENLNASAWSVSQDGTTIKAYNHANSLELTFFVDSFLPQSPQCLSNKRIKDIKFDIDVYKRAQKGDSNWAKMLERMKISFIGKGFSEEKRVYGSNLIKNNVSFRVGEVVHIGTLQFLTPYPCDAVDRMKMRVTDISVQGKRLPPLEFMIKLNK